MSQRNHLDPAGISRESPPLIDARSDFSREYMWAWARLQAQPGRSRVYFYYFKQKPPFPEGIHAGWGASHFAELWYMFDHLDQYAWRWSAADRRLARLMSTYWSNFAKSGDPNGNGLPLWPPFDGGNTVLHLGDSVIVDGVPNRDSLQVVDAVYGTLRGKPFGAR